LFVELLHLHGVDVGVDGETRVIDEHVDAPGLLLDCIHQGLHLVDLGDVGLQQEGIAQFGLEGLCALGAFEVVKPDTEPSFARALAQAVPIPVPLPVTMATGLSLISPFLIS